jgi:hypothetical protein
MQSPFRVLRLKIRSSAQMDQRFPEGLQLKAMLLSPLE